MGKYFDNETKEEISEEVKDADEIEEETEADREIMESAEKGMFRLRRPVEFEGKKIEEIDISPLQEIKAKDMDKAVNYLRMNNKYTQSNIFWSVEFLQAILITKVNIPAELIGELYSIDYMALLGTVENFLVSMGLKERTT